MKRMFKPCRDPPDFCRWRSLSCRASDPAATAATSGATSVPADERWNSRLEKGRRSGSWFIARSFPNLTTTVETWTNSAGRCRTPTPPPERVGLACCPQMNALDSTGPIWSLWGRCPYNASHTPTLYPRFMRSALGQSSVRDTLENPDKTRQNVASDVVLLR